MVLQSFSIHQDLTLLQSTKYLKVSIETGWMVSPVFYHDKTDGHTDPCCSMDNPVVLFGVYNFPHQHYWLASAERERQGKPALESIY